LHPDKTGTAPRFLIDTPELRGGTIQWLTPEGRRAHGTRHRRSRRVEGLYPPAQREEPMSKVDYYSEAAHGPHEAFELGNYQLQSGVTLPNARIAYKTHEI
jgi:hypothetical protein